MLIKPRTTPVKNFVLSAVVPRLSLDHPKRSYLEQELGRRSWGYLGEQSIDYYLSFLPDHEFFVLHGLKLSNNGHYFAIDTLLLFQRFTLIIEVKHWTGIVEVQLRGEFWKVDTDSETKQVYDDPIQQVKHQEWQLDNWARLHKIILPPIEHVVVFSYPKLQIRNAHLLSPKIIRSNNILDYIHMLKEQYLNSSEKIPLNELEKTAIYLQQKHIEEEFLIPVYHKLGLAIDEISTGVFCPVCSYAQMIRIKRTWKCPKCGNHSSDAHLKALIDYMLLFGRYSTSRELQRFLNINKAYTIRRLLKLLKISKLGNTVDSTFDLFSSEILKKEVRK